MKHMLLKLGSVFASNVGFIAFAQDSETSVKNEILRLPYCPEGEILSVSVGEAKYIDDGIGNLLKISDLLRFETEEDADEFSETIKLELSRPIQSNLADQIAPMATHEDVIVDQRKVSFAGSINLGVAYSTSGDSNTGYITYHNAYTTFTGFTLGFDWVEQYCNSQVTSSGKDIYAHAFRNDDF